MGFDRFLGGRKRWMLPSLGDVLYLSAIFGQTASNKVVPTYKSVPSVYSWPRELNIILQPWRQSA